MKKNNQLAVTKGLNFNFKNSDGQPVIYITEEASLNKIVLSVNNNTGAAITLKGGNIPTQNPPPADGPAVIYFAFSNPTLNGQLAIGNANWHFSLVTSSGTKLWALTPKEDINLANGAAIDFSFGGLTADGQNPNVQFYYEWYNFMSTADGGNTMTISIIPPPVNGLKKLKIEYGFIDPDIYVNDDQANSINNYLQFFLSNPDDTPIVPKKVQWGKQSPIFNIYFVFGKAPGYGALTDSASAAKINIGTGEQYEGLWQTEKHSQGETISFSLLPTATKNHQILGTYDNSTIQFVIGPIDTNLEPGMTNMYVSYQNIPGYQAGAFSVPIFKNKPVPGIIDLLAFPATVSFQGYASISWQTLAVDAVELEITANNQTTILKSKEGQISLDETEYQLQCNSETQLTLSAFNERGIMISQRQRTISVLLPDPEIQFSADPQVQFLAKETDPKKSVTLSWKVKYADENDGVTFNSAVSKKVFPAEGSFVYENPVAGPITLTAIKSIPNSEQILTSKETLNILFPILPLTPVKTLDVTQQFPPGTQFFPDYPIYPTDNGILLIRGKIGKGTSSQTIYHVDFATYKMSIAFQSPDWGVLFSEDNKVMFCSSSNHQGTTWKVFDLQQMTNTFIQRKALNVTNFKSTWPINISGINNAGTILFGSGGINIDSNGNGKRPIAFFSWVGDQFKLMSSTDIPYDKEQANSFTSHGQFYSQASGKAYLIPYHNELYIFDQDANYTVINLTGYELDQEAQLQGMYVSESLNMIFIYSVTQGGGFVVFDLETGALIKTFLNIVPNLLAFNEQAIIGGLDWGMGLLLPNQLPNGTFKQLFQGTNPDMFTNAALQKDLSRMSVLSARNMGPGGTPKTMLNIYEL